MSTLIDNFKQQLHNNANPLADLIEQPKHQAKGLEVIHRSGDQDAPFEDDDLEDATPAPNPYTKPLTEIEEEEGIIDDRGLPRIKGGTIDYSRQSNKIIRIADRVQMFVFGLIADVEDIEQFKFTAEEKEEFELILPDFAEENGINISNNLAMALSLCLIMLKRAKAAWQIRKAKKLALAA